MDKSPGAFRTISEVAEDLDLPQHVLRFWETRFAHIKPLKRGGGRRYYRPDDILLLRGIKHLLYGQGYTIRGVQRILKDQGPRHVMALWQDGEDESEDAPASVPADVAPRRAEPPSDEGQEPFRRIEPRLADDAEDDFDADGDDDEGDVMDAPVLVAPIRPQPIAARAAPPAPAISQPPQVRAPTIVPAPAPTAPAGPSPATRQRLEAILRELVECRRMLDRR
ncbi:MerR family transcriptional regulator [Terrihabitans sp. B22-R8]|uniref:MerR family transcriptional regulator n=1 Tax=Terrihabitans sp. B22-R8 TaxID=3425128 RepID=UPI00403C0FE0